MSDASLRSRERDAARDDSPEARAAVLVDRLRRASPCGACGGNGQTLNEPAMRDVEGWIAENVPGAAPLAECHAVPCGPCAGTGSQFRGRLELAAYCGDEAACGALAGGPGRCECGHPWTAHDTVSKGCLWKWGEAINGCSCKRGARFANTANGSPWRVPRCSEWVSGLSRFSDLGPVPGWVLVLAAVAAARCLVGPADQRDVKRATEAAELWLFDPTEDQAMRWLDRCRAGGWIDLCPHPPGDRGHRPGRWAHPCDTIAACAAHADAGEAPAREAVSRALVTWALS